MYGCCSNYPYANTNNIKSYEKQEMHISKVKQLFKNTLIITLFLITILNNEITFYLKYKFYLLYDYETQ